MRIALLLLLTLFVGCSTTPANQWPVIHHTEYSVLPSEHPEYRTTFVEEYDSGPAEDAELEGVQCPIPFADRVANHTGIQCVFSSLECLGRWGEVEQLLKPEPLTSRPGCKTGSGPEDAAGKLTKFNVKFKNKYGSNRAEAIALIKEAMAEGRGCLWDIPGHAMVLCHYDEETKIVKYIDNSDRSLKIHTITLSEFNRRWRGWIMTVYKDPGPDPFPAKAAGSLAQAIPVIDKNNPQQKYPKDYIPLPEVPKQ